MYILSQGGCVPLYVMKRLDSLSGQSGKGPGLTRGRDWPCGKCSHSEKLHKTRPAGFGGHRERDRAKATSRLSPGTRGPWEGGRLMRGGLSSSPGRTSGKPGRCQDPPGILCPASVGAEVAGGVMWVVGSAHSWDAMGWPGHPASRWHQEMKEAAVGLPFPHSKAEKDYRREVAQGPHRHPASSRHFLFRLFLWGLHERREATL